MATLTKVAAVDAESPRDGTLGCLECAQRREVELPDAVLKACERGDLVIFAGAGISTEQRLVSGPHTLHSQVAGELGLDSEEAPSFPELMSRYEAEHGRPALLRRIKKHLDFVRSFPSLHRQAGRFHQELASLYTVTEIFTTNWDTYFEEESGAQPFVTEEDWALWTGEERSIFKLHGSISNPGSIIVTEADYKEARAQLDVGLNGARLKQMLATKTIVFAGYSLRDPDFVQVYEALKERMGKLMPKAYVVTPDERDPPPVGRDMQVIATGGIHFLHMLKARFDEDELLGDQRFEALPIVRTLIAELHDHLLAAGEMRADPTMFICACYHDGLLDALDHQMANAKKGHYFHRCYTERLIDLYEGFFDERVDQGRYETAAYVHGYLTGMHFLLADDEDRNNLPAYYVPGYEGEKPLKTFDEYREAAQHFPEWEPEVYEHAKSVAARLESGVVFQHWPMI